MAPCATQSLSSVTCHLSSEHAVLAWVSPGCPPLPGRFLCITHPSATRRPKTHPKEYFRRYRSTCMC